MTPHATVTTFFLALGMTSSAAADDPACLTAPTQACVFDLAFEAADREDTFEGWSETILHLAGMQEAAGFPDSQATMVYFLEHAEHRAGDVGGLAAAMGYRPYAWEHDWLSDAPSTALQLAQLTTELHATLPDTVDDIFRLRLATSAPLTPSMAGRPTTSSLWRRPFPSINGSISSPASIVP